MTISSLVIPSPLGPLTLFADGGAIISLDWGKGDTIKGPDSAMLETAREQLKAYFAQELLAFDLPLDPFGTDFQKRVWNTMLEIPYGKTKSYGDVALEVKSSPRAVGGACGKNPIPIIIPCHRILGSKNKMGGYSGLNGTETKSQLLKLEGAEI